MAPLPILLVNPSSGNGKGQQLLESFSPHCHAEAISFPHLSDQLAALPEASTIIVAGGDGTVSTVLTHPLLPSEVSKTVLPLGTANDLSRELGLSALSLPTNIPEYLSQVAAWPSTSLAVWQLHFDGRKHRFCNYCSLGYEGAVVKAFSEWRGSSATKPSRWRNRIQYALAALRASRGTRNWSLSHDAQEAQELTGHTVILSNISSYLGFARLSIDTDYSDKKLEVSQVGGLLKYLQLLGQGFTGVQLVTRPIQIEERCRLQWGHGDVYIQADGEYLGRAKSGELSVELKGYVQVAGPNVGCVDKEERK